MVLTFVRNNPLCYSYSTKLTNRTIHLKSYFNYDYEHECSTLSDLVDKDLYVFDSRAKLIDWYNVNNLYNGLIT